MRVKGLFWILTGLLLTVLGVMTWHVFYNFSSAMFSWWKGWYLLQSFI